MSSMTFGQKSFGVKAPEKGSFPLDHDDMGENLVPTPYRYEPLKLSNQPEEEESSDSQSDSEPAVPPYAGNDCLCGNCEAVETEYENKCCKKYPEVQRIFKSYEVGCITEHPGFLGNCLNQYVLEASLYEFVFENGRIGDEEPLNEMMRYLAYRRFVRWVFGRLGKGNRKLLPACAVAKIRETFPSNFYMGFRHTVY